MKKLTLSVVVFFWGFSLFAIPSLQEKKSLQLTQKLYEDKLYRLALLEIDWFSTHYPNSSLLAKSLFFQGLTFSKKKVKIHSTYLAQTNKDRFFLPGNKLFFFIRTQFEQITC